MIADGRLLDIIRRAHTFGLTLLKMDLRQESTRHSDVIAAICDALTIGDYSSWSEEEKCKWLVRSCWCIFSIYSPTMNPTNTQVAGALLFVRTLPPYFLLSGV